MTLTDTQTLQHRLFLLNRCRPTAPVVAEIERLEAEWVDPLAHSLHADSAAPADQAALFARLDDMLARSDRETSAVRYVADECTLTGFQVLVPEFAVAAGPGRVGVAGVCRRASSRSGHGCCSLLLAELPVELTTRQPAAARRRGCRSATAHAPAPGSRPRRL
jgi:hypothetical protein